jgi:hypothetical protein
MKKILKIVIAIGAILLILYTARKAHDWWQLQGKRKELFAYLQKNSPVTKRIPKDATFYLNLFDFKRVHASLKTTNFYKVLVHWFDTGMANGNPANPLLGGMLEKTILNVIGEEFAVALLPSAGKQMDLLAVARLAPGSDFLLRLALASDRKAQRIPYRDNTLYVFQTKLVQYPKFYVCIQDNLAYAGNNSARVQQSLGQEGPGPDFLRDLAVEAIPEDTFVFARAKGAAFSGLIYGGGTRYFLKASSDQILNSKLPKLNESPTSVLQVQTNGTRIVQQPSLTYVLHNSGGLPASAIFLGFDQTNEANNYQSAALAELQNNKFSPTVEAVKFQQLDCKRLPQQSPELFSCIFKTNLLLAEGQEVLKSSANDFTKMNEERLPFTLRISLQHNTISRHFERVQSEDWQDFEHAMPFYFLSCIKQIHGAIDGSNNSIAVELM